MHYQKQFTANLKIVNADVPDLLYFPTCQHLGAPAQIIVKKDELIKKGQLIASANGEISANIHASISGKVKDISTCIHPNGNKVNCIIIENDHKDTSIPLHPIKSIKNANRQELIQKIQEAGIVGLGGATFPTHVKLKPAKPIKTLIINGAECEPYLSADHRLMVEETNKIFQGIEILQRILEPKEIIIAVESNKPDAIKALKIQSIRYPKIKIQELKTSYPQGAEKVLVYQITGKRVHRLPLDVGCMVLNVGTTAQISTSVLTGMPLIDRIVTISGELLEKKFNLKVRLGTLFSDLLPNLDYLNEPYKIIAGGPMMGVSHYSLQIPVIKSTSGILVIKNQTKKEETCIRCATCVDNCPLGLLPLLAAKKGLLALDCMECGLCSYNCPANINLVQKIKLQKILQRKASCECKK